MVTVSDLVVSVIRTLTPLLVGLVATGLLKLGVDVDSEVLTGVVVGAFTGVYYAGVRFLEAKFPKLGWLLGSAKQPTYTK